MCFTYNKHFLNMQFYFLSATLDLLIRNSDLGFNIDNTFSSNSSDELDHLFTNDFVFRSHTLDIEHVISNDHEH